MIDRRTLIRALGAGASVTIAGGSIVSCTNRPVGDERDPELRGALGTRCSGC